MKFSIAVSILILAVGGALGLMNRKRLASLDIERHQLVTQATQLGISTASGELPGEARTTRRERREGGGKSRDMAAEMISFARAIESHDQSGNDEDPEFEKLSTEMQARLMDLDAGQLKEVIDALREDKSLSDEIRQNLISYSIAMLSEDHPAAAIKLFTESASLLDESLLGSSVLSASLTRWAELEPLAALEWLRKNAADHPDITDDHAKRSIIAGAAANDPKLALKLMTEMGLDTSSAVEAMVEAGKTPEQRTSLLDTLRAHLATLPSASDRDAILAESLESMGRNLTNENFESVQSWIAGATLNPDERAHFAAGLSYFNTKEDTGRWIDWMAANLPKDNIAENVENLVGQWTQQDYQAAGKWLAAAAEGPAKQAAVSTYAETVAEYEPQTAVQWALTLPPGDERKATLESIYQNWPKTDAAAAAAFAKEHGIDTSEDEE